MRRSRLTLLAGALVVGAAAAASPNVVMILTDDQSTKLDSLEHMPKLKALVAEQGASIPNMFVATPVCCPSRSEIYTGRYIHNIGVFNNSAGSGGCSSLQWQNGPEKNNIAYFMHQLGYATSFAGKYMNNYGAGTTPGTVSALPECLNETYAREKSGMQTTCAQTIYHIPRGWDNWQALRGNSVYYNYTLSNNGVAEEHGDDYATDYLVDLAKNRTLDFIDAQWADVAEDARSPLFIVAALPGVHEPADPAPQYAYYADGLVAPRTPNFNFVAEGQSRHWMIDQVNYDAEPMNATVISFVDLLYRRRLAVCQSIDDVVEAFTLKFQDYGQLDNTYIVYTSDNGYHLGQFAVALDKRQPYETDVRVPLFIRGPGIPANVTLTNGFVVNIDLAPTFLALAGMDEDAIDDLGMDGQPATSLLFGGASERSDFLLEYNGEAYDGCVHLLSESFPDNAQSFDTLTDGIDCGKRGPNSYVTEPLWDGTETWASIQDSGNNTYSCVRTVNATSDVQYCEWVSGEVEYYDIMADEWQMTNLAPKMDPELKRSFSRRLAQLVSCQGRKDCNGDL